jgi:hypothetical protein
MLSHVTKLITEHPWRLVVGLLWAVSVIAAYRTGYRDGYNSTPVGPTISATSTSAATAEVATEVRCPVTVVTVPAGGKPGTRYDTAVPVTSSGKVTVATTSTSSARSEPAPPAPQPSGVTDRGPNTISVGWTHGQAPSELRSYQLTYERYLMYGISSHLTYRALDRSVAIGLGLSF